MWPLAKCISSVLVQTPSSQLGVLQLLRGSFQLVQIHPLTLLAYTSGGIQSGVAASPSPTKAAQVRHKGVNPFTHSPGYVIGHLAGLAIRQGTAVMACTVHGEPSGSRWQKVRNFFASLSLLRDLACNRGSALLRILTLLASPDDGEGSGWAGQVGAADIL